MGSKASLIVGWRRIVSESFPVTDQSAERAEAEAVQSRGC